ncbi:hypothetical protein ITJ57_18975 [Plantibacter sp. VKM Ac-2880]|uniref:hypothetical protein n=1 Tax=Plantibacter sp. VKM Ac-2880 TaxID=2783827 RepID=UPI00188F3F7A|nr:hypothetical protein [Plantibacter sp. VKM Ac-2880]MBF4570856.1 hypothetical protein [Plantibacter sp. VKM Ac-2880]
MLLIAEVPVLLGDIILRACLTDVAVAELLSEGAVVQSDSRSFRRDEKLDL